MGAQDFIDVSQLARERVEGLDPVTRRVFDQLFDHVRKPVSVSGVRVDVAFFVPVLVDVAYHLTLLGYRWHEDENQLVTRRQRFVSASGGVFEYEFFLPPGDYPDCMEPFEVSDAVWSQIVTYKDEL